MKTKNIEFFTNPDDLLYAYRKFCEIYRNRDCMNANKYIENPFRFAQTTASTALQPELESGKLLQLKDVNGDVFYVASEGPCESSDSLEVVHVRLRNPSGTSFVYRVNYKVLGRRTSLENMPYGSLKEADISLDLLKLAGVDLNKCPLKDTGTCIK